MSARYYILERDKNKILIDVVLSGRVNGNGRVTVTRGNEFEGYTFDELLAIEYEIEIPKRRS